MALVPAGRLLSHPHTLPHAQDRAEGAVQDWPGVAATAATAAATAAAASARFLRQSRHGSTAAATAATAAAATDCRDRGDKGDRANVEMLQNHAHAARPAPYGAFEFGG